MHHWFKSYGHFTFAYCGSCIGKGLRLQPAQQACFSSSWPFKTFLRSWRFQRFYIWDYSRIFTSSSIQELFDILDHFRIFPFLTIPEFLLSGKLQKFVIPDNSRIIIFWTIPELLLSGPYQKFSFLTLPEFLNIIKSFILLYVLYGSLQDFTNKGLEKTPSRWKR